MALGKKSTNDDSKRINKNLTILGGFWILEGILIAAILVAVFVFKLF